MKPREDYEFESRGLWPRLKDQGLFKLRKQEMHINMHRITRVIKWKLILDHLIPIYMWGLIKMSLPNRIFKKGSEIKGFKIQDKYGLIPKYLSYKFEWERERGCFAKVLRVSKGMQSNIHTHQVKSFQAKARQQHTKVFVSPLNLAVSNNTRFKTTNAKQSK